MLIKAVLSSAAVAVSFYLVQAYFDPHRQKKIDAKKISSKKLGQLGVNRREVKLTEYEEQIAVELILPEDIPITFEDIGGLDGIISRLQESVIAPLCLTD